MDVIMRKNMKRQMHGNGMPTRETISGMGQTSWMTCQAVGVDPNNPFKSSKQRKYLYSQKPEVAKKFAKHTGGPVKDPMMSAKQMKKSMKGGM